MSRWSRSALLIIIALALVPMLTPSNAQAVSINWCSQPGGEICLCIEWEQPQGTYLDIRCPGADHFQDGEIIALPGPFQGSGVKIGANPPHPGLPLTLDLLGTFNRAFSLIQTKLLFDPKCQALFNGSQLGLHPAVLASEYIEYRDGTGLTTKLNGQMVVPCERGYDAWTKCCNHDPYVYLCPSLAQRNDRVAARKILHEVLHVAGQDEDATSSVGPNDHPTPGQLDDAVKEACGL